MRKTKSCVTTRLDTLVGRLTMRTCERPRNHEGMHHDKYGNWKEEAHAEG